MNTAILRWAVIAMTLVSIAALSLFYGSFYTPHHDLSGSVMSGAFSNALGADFPSYVVYFPPTEKVWFAFADWFGRFTGIGGNLAVILMTGLAVSISVTFGSVIRMRTTGAGLGFFVISFLVLTIIPIIYKNVFGLREHMVILGLWPWFVLRAAPVGSPDIGQRLRILLGVWMGLMLTFKYLYAVVVMLVELADALSQKKFSALFRIECLVAGAVVAVYLGVWLGASSETREAIGIMRSAISANFRSPEATQTLLLQRGAAILLFLGLGWLFGVSWRTLWIGLAVVTGAIIVAWFQGRWYSHHRFPITIGLLAWLWLMERKIPKWTQLTLLVFFAITLFWEYKKTSKLQVGTASLSAALQAENIDLAGKRVGLLTQHPSPYNEIIAAEGGFRWAPYANIAYVSTALKPLDIPQNDQMIAPPMQFNDPGWVMLHGSLISLWEDHPPDVLIFDRTRSWPLRYLVIDWRHVLSGDPRFNAILDHYELVVSHDGENVDFEYYVRTD